MSEQTASTSEDPLGASNRRDFFKLVGAGAGAAAAATVASPLLPASAFAADSPKFKLGEPRPAFILDPDVLYMNIGTTGSTPKHILKSFDDDDREVARNPLETFGGVTPMRQAIAPGFGAQLEEFVISYNTTDGMNKILAGVELNAGDEIITTNHEHPGGNGPMNLLLRRRGVKIVVLPLPVGNDQRATDYVDLFRAAITNKTKAFVFSAPTFLTGTMLPYKRLAKLAQSKGIMTIVDGAHATGMFALDFNATGIDFWGCSGHKWQCGPGGTGVLYIRNRVDRNNPLPLFNFWPTNTNNTLLTGPRTNENAATYGIGTALQSIGNPNYPMLKAFAETCQFWDRIGRRTIEKHDLTLSLYLKGKIAEVWGVEHLYSPKDDPELLSALTSFSPFHKNSLVLQLGDAATAETNQSTEFVTRMREEYGIVIRNTAVPVIGSPAPHHPMRISTHLFHSARDVDRLVRSMKDLAMKMGVA
ncbi:aminotransferase class V-fold PLP-dependent enzyme [Chelatococcus sambhunathii]|uniref:Aminotransferase class V-fold PLP-dependent enzyme n=1 Tax=Chelatococcus sambhunathii TaxID=363953 RepID=A0ABU1DKJ8_9HYPH|nr:aminotransferase class V-fold PLP-dependent enzyme [Chelatococcus sambhunathii]MDR4308545.1 aminotransferase class V-fold PLP-dependent enzyme [Chelatococcus sambhunathii]